MPLRHMGAWRYSSFILDLWTRWSVQHHVPAALPPETKTWYPLGWPQSHSERCEKNLLPLPGIEPQPSSPQLVSILPELSRILAPDETQVYINKKSRGFNTVFESGQSKPIFAVLICSVTTVHSNKYSCLPCLSQLMSGRRRAEQFAYQPIFIIASNRGPTALLNVCVWAGERRRVEIIVTLYNYIRLLVKR
jgi:hypothetical protein